jgi:Tfp pilus assembly protein PilV
MIDVLVALAVISLGVVGIAGAFSAVSRSAALSQEQSQVEVRARQVGDLVRDRAQLTYQSCALASQYQTELNAALTVPSGWKYSIDYVNLAAAATRNGVDATSTLAACPGGLYDGGVQQVSVTVTCSPPVCALTGTHKVTRVVWKAST